VTKTQQLKKTDQRIQRLRDDSFHRWYRFVLAFPDHLVTSMMERMDIGDTDLVLDPFCGTGTTLVECQRRGVPSVGIDSSPLACLASRVKTNWSLSSGAISEARRVCHSRLAPLLRVIVPDEAPLWQQNAPQENRAVRRLRRAAAEATHAAATEAYIRGSGMLDRGWISEIPFLKTLVLKDFLLTHFGRDKGLCEALLLALAASVVQRIANVRFGPEIYCIPGKKDVDVLAAFETRLRMIEEDLAAGREAKRDSRARVVCGDARDVAAVLASEQVSRVTRVVTSPPYPTEKDYTRNTRLELAYLDFVTDRKSLQRLKKQMIRSHSKGIYKADADFEAVKDVPEVCALASELRAKAAGKTYGFAKMYPRIIEEYFGGMQRHFYSLYEAMQPAGTAAYVVGEQTCYLQTYTPTGTLLGLLAERAGFSVIDLLHWRSRVGTTGNGKEIKEEILLLRRRPRGRPRRTGLKAK